LTRFEPRRPGDFGRRSGADGATESSNWKPATKVQLQLTDRKDFQAVSSLRCECQATARHTANATSTTIKQASDREKLFFPAIAAGFVPALVLTALPFLLRF
jgi:broad specificity phosphatase PhoE